MPIPVPLILAGVAALLLFGGGDEEDNGKAQAPPGPGPGPSPGLPPIPMPKPPTPMDDIPPVFSYGDCFDDHLPEELKNQFNQALANITNVSLLDQAAATAAAGGFPKVAACLKQKADELRGGPPPIQPPVASGNMPYMLGFGDYPYGLSAYYTGQGMRYKELEPLNPQLGPMENKNGVSQYRNWDQLAANGETIILPAGWNPWQTPLPQKPGPGRGYKSSGVMPS